MIGFKQFLNEASGSYSWDMSRPYWYKSTLGDRPTIRVYISKDRVSMDESPFHPYMKRAIFILIKQYPELKKIKIDFDGWSPGTVEDYLNSNELHQKKDILPKYLYTGTSLFRWERIKEEGLKPRSETGVNAAYGAAITSAPPANPDHVYFSATFNATPRFAAFDANKEDYEHGSVPVVLRIDSKGLDYNKLKADVDVRSSDWKSSFHNINTIAYAGNVSPKYIELFRVWNFKTNEWEMPGSQIEPKDWLAQQILHPDQYKNIDDSTAKYKWAKVGRK